MKKLSVKTCPNCGKQLLSFEDKCHHCGFVLETLKNKDPLEIEKMAVAVFENQGWKVNLGGRTTNMACDLVLSAGNRIYGYVDLFINLNDKGIARKLNIAKKFISENKPRFYIITNLVTYYVSTDGGPFEAKDIALFVDGYIIKNIIEEYFEKEDSKNGN